MAPRRLLLVLALLPWLLFGHGRPRLPNVATAERAAFAESALEHSTSPSARLLDASDLLRWLATTSRAQRAPVCQPQAGGIDTLPVRALARRPTWSPPRPLPGWRGFRAKRLIVPHYANAPPTPQS